MLYKGSCHCGKVAFEVEGELTGAVACNCSICSRKGALLWAAPRESLRLLRSEDMGKYVFNKHRIEHRFCRFCGGNPFAEDAETQADRSVYVNVRCLEGVDVKALEIIEFDGRAM